MDGSSDARDLTRNEPFHVMTMPYGPACNLECEYCYYLEKSDLYPDRTDFEMTEDTLETFVKQYIEAHPGHRVTFAWQGGEPTLRGLDFYREAVQLQRKHAPADVEVVNTVQTNGTRLDGEWCRFLADEDFLVGISIDGPRDLHNRYRQTRADGSTFDEVMHGLSLLQEHGVEYNVLCVVNDCNSRQPRRVYDFFKRNGVEWLQFIPLVEQDADPGGTPDGSGPPRPAEDVAAGTVDPSADQEGPNWVRDRGGAVAEADDDYSAVLDEARDVSVTERSVDPETYGEFMCTIFDEWVRNDVGDVSVRLFDQCLEMRLRGEASYCVLSETCGNQVAMEHDGDVYACDHFVEPAFRLGNVHDTHLSEVLDSESQREFGRYKREGLPPRCRACDVRQYCHGGCPKNRHLETPDGELGLNYLCGGYRRFFTYVQPYLDLFERTAAENAPLELVMDEVAVLDERSASG